MLHHILTFIYCYLVLGVLLATYSARSIYCEQITRRSLYIAVTKTPYYKELLCVIITIIAVIPGWPFLLSDKLSRRKSKSTAKTTSNIVADTERTELPLVTSYIGALVKKYDSIAAVEAEYMVSNPRLGDKPIPFGFNNREWLELLTKMQDGDELWSYSTSADSWNNLAGRAGVRLIRGDRVVADIMTIMN